MPTILYYFHDPMCSWCYAFQPTWQEIKTRLPSNVEQINVLGGLAPDEDEKMSESLQLTIQHHWQRIQQVVPGTEFNFDFWSDCKPRRSTYPACRAVIAAANQDKAMEEPMIQAIQHAYYRDARNPSDYSTHVELAGDLELNVAQFEADLTSPETEQKLQQQLHFTSSFNVSGYPALVLTVEDKKQSLPIDYNNAETVLKIIIDDS